MVTLTPCCVLDTAVLLASMNMRTLCVDILHCNTYMQAFPFSDSSCHCNGLSAMFEMVIHR